MLGDWALSEVDGTQALGRAIRGRTLGRDLLSWIVFAGANRTAAAERTRSLLSASEIKGLDLTGCGLVVASACETNAGARFFGEGIAGLNCALHFAGARFSITSLWRVADQGALLFFSTFYSPLRDGAGRSVLSAFRETRSRLQRRVPAAVWAAFVLYGAARSNVSVDESRSGA